jgi:hydrogenase nickel incorporation protein HypB
MCKDCGCGKAGPTRIDGKPAEEVSSPIVAPAEPAEGVEHTHTHHHEGGSTHSHPHSHAGAHSHQTGEVPAHEHAHGHTHSPIDAPDHDHPHEHVQHHVEVNQSILSANDRQAERNRGFFKALGLLTLNVVSSPGSGKTTFIQKTIAALNSRIKAGVIVGDLETDNDARRLRESGAAAVQITTGTMCHLEAAMVARALSALGEKKLDLLIIENVGNLVCPAAFDLGEDLRVVLLSVTEGEDKPLKYPPMFHSADVVVITKNDLAQAVEFKREVAMDNLRRISHHAEVFEVSAKSGAGMEAWCQFLLKRLNK